MEQIIQKTIDNLNKRGFLAEYAETSADAKARVMELVKGAESIGDGLIPDNLNTEIYDSIYIVSDEEAMEAFYKLCRFEGIIPAVESSHAVAYAMKYAREHDTGSILVCLSGRGDKDMDFVVDQYGLGERFFE